MNDISDTPDLSRRWCPGCEPERDPFAEILREERCMEHGGALPLGPDDHLVRVDTIGTGMGMDADGANCRAAAALIHAARCDG